MGFCASGGGTGTEWRTAPDATNYIELLRIVQQFADDTNEGISSNADITSIPNGGTLYALGDFVRVADGNGDASATVVHPSVHGGNTATFEVTGVSGGVVTALRLRNSGCYSTNPANNGTAGEYDTVALTGIGDNALTVTLTFSGNGWTINRVTQEIATATIGATAGTGYAVADTMEITNGDTRTGYDSPQGTNKGVLTTVTAVTTGTAMTVTDGGIFHRQPGTDEIQTTVLTGGGDGAMTVDLTYQEFTDTTTDFELIMTGAASTVGLRSFSNGSTVYNWEVMGIQLYSATADWDAQVNASPGRYPNDDDGSYMVLQNSTMGYFLSITDRRIVLVPNLSTGVYSNNYSGSFDAYATSAEYPDPTIVIGCSSARDLVPTSAQYIWAGMNMAIAESAAKDGPGAILSAGGVWEIVQNSDGPTPTTLNGSSSTTVKLIPGGQTSVALDSSIATANRIVEGTDDPFYYYVSAGIGQTGTNTLRVLPMGNTGQVFPMMFTIQIVDLTFLNGSISGELDGVKWVDKRLDASNIFSQEDELDDGTDYWYVFNNCRITDNWAYFAIRGS